MKSKVFAAHQPNFFPYLGFFDKMIKSDVFVIMDDALFVTRDFHHRNRIRINSLPDPRSKWLTVPVHNPKDYIKHVKIKKDTIIEGRPWNIKILDDIKEHYHNAPFFGKYFPQIQKILDNSDDNLLSLNIKIISFLTKEFNINTPILLSSELKIKPPHYTKVDPNEAFVKTAKALGSQAYLSGAGAKVYLNQELFDKEDIKVKYQEFHHPQYPQAYPGFLPNMCALDALFCCGKFPENEIQLQQSIKN